MSSPLALQRLWETQVASAVVEELLHSGSCESLYLLSHETSSCPRGLTVRVTSSASSSLCRRAPSSLSFGGALLATARRYLSACPAKRRKNSPAPYSALASPASLALWRTRNATRSKTASLSPTALQRAARPGAVSGLQARALSAAGPCSALPPAPRLCRVLRVCGLCASHRCRGAGVNIELYHPRLRSRGKAFLWALAWDGIVQFKRRVARDSAREHSSCCITSVSAGA